MADRTNPNGKLGDYEMRYGLSPVMYLNHWRSICRTSSSKRDHKEVPSDTALLRPEAFLSLVIVIYQKCVTSTCPMACVWTVCDEDKV